MRPYLTDEPRSTVLARVALRLVQIRLRQLGSTKWTPTMAVYSTSSLLPPNGFADLRFALHSLAAHLTCGYSSQSWYAGVAYRAALGGVFRWHFFAAYKEPRRLPPPVSNTGGRNWLSRPFDALDGSDVNE